MKINSFIVDAFTDKLFTGNQASVCLLDKELDASLMQQIAKEFGYSETAFVLGIGNNTFAIRYFSPKMEIPLCGHATLASAKVLFSEYKSMDKLTFKTHSGYTLDIVNAREHIEMFIPLLRLQEYTLSKEILTAIGIDEILNCAFNKEHNMVMVEIEDSLMLRALRPDFNALRSIDTTISGVVITALSKEKEYNYEYRYFWPWSGTDEDPVTGAVQSFLAPYWGGELQLDNLNAYQCSERTGSMALSLLKDKVVIKSNAVIFNKGVVNLP